MKETTYLLALFRFKYCRILSTNYILVCECIRIFLSFLFIVNCFVCWYLCSIYFVKKINEIFFFIRTKLPIVKAIYMAKQHCQGSQVFMICKSIHFMEKVRLNTFLGDNSHSLMLLWFLLCFGEQLSARLFPPNFIVIAYHTRITQWKCLCDSGSL